MVTTVYEFDFRLVINENLHKWWQVERRLRSDRDSRILQVLYVFQ